MSYAKPFTSMELKNYIMHEIEQSRIRNGIPLATIAHRIKVDTAEELVAHLDPQNVDTSLDTLVIMAHAVGLRMRISLE